MEGKELRRKRLSIDLKQDELAELLGISSNTISRYETGNLVIPKAIALAMETVVNRVSEAEKERGKP